MDLGSFVSSRRPLSAHGSTERPRIPATLFVAVVGVLLAVMAFFTFDKMDAHAHRAAVGADASANPAILTVSAGSARAKVDQIAVTDAKII